MVTKTRPSTLKSKALKLGLSIAAATILAACGAASTTSPTSVPQAALVATVAAAPATSAPTELPATVAATEAVATTEVMTATVPAVATEAMTATAESAAPASAESVVFQIDPAQSQASFTLGEKLMGEDKTVVGTTSKLTGVISVTMGNPSSSQIGAIQIDASDFTTDSNMRNGAIKRFILESSKSEFQYITFEPTAIEGLPTAAVAVGTAIPVKITGNLKIRDVVQPVTFDATLTMKSETELEGTAKTSITRAAYNITIPNVPSVADVTDNVDIELKFVATKQA